MDNRGVYMITAGISRIGGKYRLRKELLKRTPYHEFFLSPFCGACWYELNKPRCRYECFNDADAELINYLLQIRKHPEEFDDLKQGVFGLVSQEICNRIINGKLQPENDVERAYFFYYLNKLTFGGVEGGESNYRGLTIPNGGDGRLNDQNIEKAKVNYKGLQGSFHQVRQTDVKKARASYKGINPKTTRPFSNNDCGLLTPLDPKAIKRLRYVNLTAYDFRKVYDLFYKAFYERKGLGPECLIYTDPPYPGTEGYYGSGFGEEEHKALVERMLDSPFHWMHSIGGECEALYIEPLKEEGWVIDPVKTKYSTDANSQNDIQEYICMNYDINELPLMQFISEQNTIENFI
jgi:site-specific DNA-adenine methylase